jgi:SM-20-related protein
MIAPEFTSTLCDDELSQTLFERIASDIEDNGFSINPTALPVDLTADLYTHIIDIKQSLFESAGIGREQHYQTNNFVRSDEICWITGESDAGERWLRWIEKLHTFLNRQLFLGLFSFESHFAHYLPGSFYKRHYDAFKGETNRILTVVVYLNPEWTSEDGGELVIYRDPLDHEGIRVIPIAGTIVVFLSEEFSHEVLVSNRDRYSIAGWFRVNMSTSQKADPPK